jgi:hypothetical protein
MKNNNIQFWVIVVIVALIAGILGSFVGAKISGNSIALKDINRDTEGRVYYTSEVYNKSEVYNMNDMKSLFYNKNDINYLARVFDDRISKIESNLSIKGNSILLSSLFVKDDKIYATFYKNFTTTSVHLRSANPADTRVFGQFGTNTDLINLEVVSPSPLFSKSGAVKGNSYKLCHGNNINICSQSVTLT